jgi:hypothetical protein
VDDRRRAQRDPERLSGRHQGPDRLDRASDGVGRPRDRGGAGGEIRSGEGGRGLRAEPEEPDRAPIDRHGAQPGHAQQGLGYRPGPAERRGTSASGGSTRHRRLAAVRDLAVQKTTRRPELAGRSAGPLRQRPSFRALVGGSPPILPSSSATRAGRDDRESREQSGPQKTPLSPTRWQCSSCGTRGARPSRSRRRR